jgi:hypothetical protein
MRICAMKHSAADLKFHGTERIGPKPDARSACCSGQTSMKRSFRRTFGRAASCRRVKLLKFGLKFLVDEQQRFHRADHVAATGGYNLIDDSVGTI